MRIPKNTNNVTVFNSEAIAREFRIKRKSRKALEEIAEGISTGVFYMDQMLDPSVRREIAFPVLLGITDKQRREIESKCAMVYAPTANHYGTIPEYKPDPSKEYTCEVKVFNEARFIHVNDINYLVDCIRKRISSLQMN